MKFREAKEKIQTVRKEFKLYRKVYPLAEQITCTRYAVERKRADNSLIEEQRIKWGMNLFSEEDKQLLAEELHLLEGPIRKAKWDAALNFNSEEIERFKVLAPLLMKIKKLKSDMVYLANEFKKGIFLPLAVFGMLAIINPSQTDIKQAIGVSALLSGLISLVRLEWKRIEDIGSGFRRNCTKMLIVDVDNVKNGKCEASMEE